MSVPSHLDEKPNAPPLLPAPNVAPMPPTRPTANRDPSGQELVVAGQVVSANDGTPIADAFVFADSPEAIVQMRDAVTTDAEGKFSLPVRVGSKTTVRVVANGYVSANSVVTLETVRDEQVVRLSRGLSVRGYVVDNVGRPMGEVSVWCSLEENRVGWPHSQTQLDLSSGGARAVSGADGSFVMTGLVAEHSYELVASKEFYARSAVVISDPARAPPQSLVLVPVAEVVIRVKDKETRRAIAALSAKISTSPASEPTGTGPRDELMRPGAPQIGVGMIVTRWSRPSGVDVVDPAIQVSIDAPGYQPTRVELSGAWGAQRAFDVEMIPIRPSAPAAARIHAAFEGGPPFSGELSLLIYGSTHSAGTFPGGERISFENGRPTEDLVLPPDVYRISPNAIGSEGVWWYSPAARVSVDVRNDQDGDKEIVLRGSQLKLEVRDKSGVRRRGYGLQIVYQNGKGPGHFLPDWDIPNASGWRGAGARREERVFVSPGRGTVKASLPAVGSGTAEFEATSDGREIPVSIVLLQPPTGVRRGR